MYQKKVLKNGVRIISEKIDHVRTVSLGIWVKNGSRYEPENLSGISHFIEHMLFKGTQTRSAKDIAISMDTLGGGANAFTDKENTCYYIKLLDTNLKIGAELLADMFLRSSFSQKELDLERGVVLEEIGMYEDSPEDVAVEKLFESCYRSSALGRPILGTAQTLANINSEEMHAYVAEYYRPQDTVIAVSGHFSDDDLDYIADLFSEMQGAGTNQITQAPYQKSIVLRKKEIEQNHLCLAFPGISMLSENRYAMNLMHNILGGGMSSRLFQRIREEHGLCYSVYSFVTGHIDTGLFSIYTGLSPNTEEKALSLIAEELQNFCRNGVSEAELNRAREQIKTTFLMGLENTGSRMISIGKSELMRGEVSSTEEIIERYDAVTKEDILTLAQQTFDFENLSLSIVGTPKEESYYRSVLNI